MDKEKTKLIYLYLFALKNKLFVAKYKTNTIYGMLWHVLHKKISDSTTCKILFSHYLSQLVAISIALYMPTQYPFTLMLG